MMDEAIIVIGGLGILALLLLLAHSLNAELPEKVCDPVWKLETGSINWMQLRTPISTLDIWLAVQAQTRREQDTRDLLRWADDGGSA